KDLVFLTLIVFGVAFLMRRALIRIYSKAQFTLEQTLSEPSPPRHVEAEPVATALGPLAEVQTQRVRIAGNSPVAGRLIRHLGLRAQTGASIIVIERAGMPIVNPNPDEEILAGDEVLLLGNGNQLAKAKRFFDGVRVD